MRRRGHPAPLFSFYVGWETPKTKRKMFTEKRPLYLDTEYTDCIVPTNKWFKGKEPSNSGSTKCSELAKKTEGFVSRILSFCSSKETFKRNLYTSQGQIFWHVNLFYRSACFHTAVGEIKRTWCPSEKVTDAERQIKQQIIEEPMIVPPSNDMPTR